MMENLFFSWSIGQDGLDGLDWIGLDWHLLLCIVELGDRRL